MKQPGIRLRTISSAIAIAACLLAASPAIAASPSATALPMGKKIYYCHEGLEQFMPGDYYACRAKYYFQRGHYRLGLADLEESAHWANKNAQYTLGVLYSNGDVPGIPQNRALGLAWLALSIERKNQPTYRQAYEHAYLHSSPADVAEANRLYKQLRTEYGDQIAGSRAVHRFNREMWPLEGASHQGGASYTLGSSASFPGRRPPPGSVNSQLSSSYLAGFTDYPEPASKVVQALYERASTDFDGLQGWVTVGAVQSLGETPAPSGSATTQ